MRKLAMALAFCLSVFTCFSQRIEMQARIGSGFYFFHGNSAVKEQWASIISSSGQPYATPYGKKPGFSVTVGGNFKYVARSKFLAGLGTGFQSLSARSTIDTLAIFSPYSSSYPSGSVNPANGSSTFRGNFINLSPFLGWRFKTGKTSLDLMTGLEFGFLIKSKHRIKIDSPPTDYERGINPKETDIRLNFAADLNYKKFVFFAGYTRGLTNYYHSMIGANLEAYSNFIQLGVGYRLK